MKIAIAADPMSGLGPTASAYWYRTYHLGEGLLRRGHDVTFFAACTSTTSARLIPPGDMVGWGEPEYQNIANAIRRSHEFDVLSVTGFKGTFFADFAACPVIHNLAYGQYWQAARRVLSRNRTQMFSANSRRLTEVYPELNWQGVVHNAVHLPDFAFNDDPEDFFFSFGRIAPEKGTHLAVEVAERTGAELVIGGSIWDQHYFTREVEPRLGPRIRYVGDLSFADKVAHYRKAKAFLFPICWEEAFGNVMVESLACGTPVIALSRGAVPEVVQDGVSGFVCESIDEMASAARVVGRLPRADVRADCEHRFPVSRMVEGYERLFTRVAGTS